MKPKAAESDLTGAPFVWAYLYSASISAAIVWHPQSSSASLMHCLFFAFWFCVSWLIFCMHSRALTIVCLFFFFGVSWVYCASISGAIVWCPQSSTVSLMYCYLFLFFCVTWLLCSVHSCIDASIHCSFFFVKWRIFCIHFVFDCMAPAVVCCIFIAHMCIHICMCILMYIDIYINICMCTYVCICTYIYIHLHTFTYTYVHIYIYMYIDVCIYIYIYTYICICICVRIHISI